MIGVASMAIVLLLLSAEQIEPGSAIALLAFVLLTTAFGIANLRFMAHGRVEIDGDQVVEHTRVSTRKHALSDVAAVRVKSTAELGFIERAFNWMLGLDIGERFVELQLKRSARLGLWDAGSDIVGVPTGAFTVSRLYVEDPDGLAEELKKRLNQGQDIGGQDGRDLSQPP